MHFIICSVYIAYLLEVRGMLNKDWNNNLEVNSVFLIFWFF